MSVNILVYGADKESDEYEAAIKMREVIKNTLPNSILRRCNLIIRKYRQ